MIKPSLYSAAAFLILHAAFVQWAPPHKPMPQHQWQANLIKAQGWMYGSAGMAQNVVVGSSLSARLVMEKLPNVYNLAFGGLGVLDGLDVLVQSDIRPNLVFVEMNMVLRERHPDFVSALHQPVLFHLRKWFPALREENQPVAMVVKTFSPRMRPEPNEHIDREAGSVFAKMLALQVEYNSKVPEKSLLEQHFNQLKTAVLEVQKRGATVVFFEMPVNEKLSASPQVRSIREYFQRSFPPARYKYIASPDSGRYLTTDGVHLGPEEALQYTDYFKSVISKDLPGALSDPVQTAK